MVSMYYYVYLKLLTLVSPLILFHSYTPPPPFWKMDLGLLNENNYNLSIVLNDKIIKVKDYYINKNNKDKLLDRFIISITDNNKKAKNKT